MEKLNEKEWEPFHLGSIADISSGRDIYADERESGSIPYITSGGGNNGVGYFVSNNNETLDSNYIAVNRNGAVGKAFYHPSRSLMGNDCRKIHLTQTLDCWPVGQFVANCISQQSVCFSYSRKLGTARANQMQVMLPVTENSEPDYVYMKQYTCEMRNRKVTRYREYVEKRIAKLEHVDVVPLDKKEWGEFRIGQLFEVSRPKARSKDDYDEGDIPFVASGTSKNGVVKCCVPKSGEVLDAGNCITVSPVDGSSFYQTIDFLGRGGAGSSILILRSNNLNEFVGQFMARAIQQTCSKYTYGHMGNKDSIKRERIMLPIDEDGNPDYAYMEQYAKNLMLMKYEQYLSFLDNVSN